MQGPVKVGLFEVQHTHQYLKLWLMIVSFIGRISMIPYPWVLEVVLVFLVLLVEHASLGHRLGFVAKRWSKIKLRRLKIRIVN